MSLSIDLMHANVQVRVARLRDAKTLQRLMQENREWLRPWEATNPFGPSKFDVRNQIRLMLRALDNQQGIPFVILYQGEVVGQLNVSNIVHGSLSSATLGYWIIPQVAGKNITPTAVALVTDYLLSNVGLHRVEIDIRPENVASLRVVQKLGFRFEGRKDRYIHINGAWRDHFIFAITQEEVENVLKRWQAGAVPNLDYPFSTDSVKHTEQNPEHYGS